MDTSCTSSYRACSMAGRVVLIHDMPDRTVISELDIEQADLLLEQLELAIGERMVALRSEGVQPVL